MQLIFNHLLSPRLDLRRACAKYLSCLGLILVVCLISDNAIGQRPGNFRGPIEPHDFGDTPSPTEMMARLKYHKQQETPLFDLLREAGVDIFAKLSDDEKKLAGRFVEDMILKEGLDSEKVSSLMEKMNIGDEAKQALQEGIERAGVGESAISPEQRKELANKIRQEFLQRSDSQSDTSESSTNANGQQPEEARKFTDRRDREAENRRREELGLARLPDEDSVSANRTTNLDRREEFRRQLEKLQERTNRTKELIKKRTQPNGTDRRIAESNPDPNADARNLRDQPNQSDRQLADSGSSTNSNARQSRNERPGRDRSDRASGGNNSRGGNRRTGGSQNRPAKQAFDQLEAQLNESQRKIVSEFREKIQQGDISRQEIGELLGDLQNRELSQGFERQLDRAGKKFGLPMDSRMEIQQAYSELSSTERNSLKQAFDGVDENLLKQLAGNVSGLGDGPPNSARSDRTGTRSDSDLEEFEQVFEESLESLRMEQLGQDFLKDALETYNNADSGYELSPAFKQLKDRAEGKASKRQMANLGNISKELFDGSSNIFNPDSASNSGRPDGIKPGQRLDQLLAAAADKALTKDDSGGGESKSLFSDALNGALGVALDQAVTIADKNNDVRSREARDRWSQSAPTPSNNLTIQDRLDSFRNLSSTQQGSDPSSASRSPSNSSSSSSESSLDEAAATIADSVSQMKFDGRSLMYAAGLIALIAALGYLVYRLLPSTDETVLKRRELQRKLQSNSTNPKDVVEAVDLYLLSRFGAVSAWWNSKHAADQITTDQPDWRDKVLSLFDVYRWSRYQADGNASVSAEQSELVNSTLKELSQVSEQSAGKDASKLKSSPEQSSGVEDEATS